MTVVSVRVIRDGFSCSTLPMDYFQMALRLVNALNVLSHVTARGSINYALFVYLLVSAFVSGSILSNSTQTPLMDSHEYPVNQTKQPPDAPRFFFFFFTWPHNLLAAATMFHSKILKPLVNFRKLYLNHYAIFFLL